jgi:predicted porin
VTLFGIADAAMRNVNNQGAGSAKSVVSGSNSTSRIGLRGTEDLGSGLSASFHLEHGLLLDSGTPASGTKFWDRRATVALASKTLGEVRLGRDYVPTYSSWTRYDPFSYVGVGRSADFFSGTPTGPIKSSFGSFDNTLVRADNGAQYLLPTNLGGLEGGITLAPSQGGDASQGRAKIIGARLGYDGGSYTVSAATMTSQNSLTTLGKFKDSTVGASVKLGPVNVMGAWRQLKYGKAEETVTMLSAVGTFDAHQVKASWQKADMAGSVGATVIDANDATKLALGYQFNLSKRSALYATVARISNDGAAKFAIPSGPSGLVAGGDSTGYEFGMRHSF